MGRRQRAALVQSRLAALYAEPPIPLRHRDPYTLLVAVVLSAQCTDERVNRVTPALFERAGTPGKMMRLPVATVEQCIRSCGLAPQKARAIVGLSRILVERHGGEVPRALADLERLPGVGHKTASVLQCQCFETPAFPVDTHIHRLAQRWGLSGSRNVRGTEEALKGLFAPAAWCALHLQMIYYGREHCTARGCDGTVCELCRACYPRRRRAAAIHRA